VGQELRHRPNPYKSKTWEKQKAGTLLSVPYLKYYKKNVIGNLAVKHTYSVWRPKRSKKITGENTKKLITPLREDKNSKKWKAFQPSLPVKMVRKAN